MDEKGFTKKQVVFVFFRSFANIWSDWGVPGWRCALGQRGRGHDCRGELPAFLAKLLVEAQAMEKQKNTEIEVKSANVEEGNASAILTETDGKVAVVVVVWIELNKVERHIINGLKTLYPDHQFIGEESMAEVNIEENLQEHNDDYENVEADDD